MSLTRKTVLLITECQYYPREAPKQQKLRKKNPDNKVQFFSVKKEEKHTIAVKFSNEIIQNWIKIRPGFHHI